MPVCIFQKTQLPEEMLTMDPRYPIGNFEMPRQITTALRQQAMDEIAALPAKMRAAVKGLNEAQLDTPYRADGWTVRQVLHHVPDSHLNAYMRLKLALTEDSPTIKPYEEARWAELADSRDTPIEVSLNLLESLHTRWVTLLHSLRDEDYARTFTHPDHGKMTVDWLLQLYAWHSRHHVGHVTSLRARKGW